MRSSWNWFRRNADNVRKLDGAWYAVQGDGDAWLEADTAAAVRCRNDTPAAARLLLFVPDADPGFGCFVAPDAGPIRFNGCAITGLAVPVHLVRPGSDRGARIHHMLDMNRRLGIASDRGSVAGELAFAPSQTGIGSNFHLEPVAFAAVPTQIHDIGCEIADATDMPPCWERLVARMRRGELRRGLTKAMLSRLPLDELRGLADRLATSPTLRTLMRGSMPDDTWMSERLDELLHWRDQRARAERNNFCLQMTDAPDLPGAASVMTHGMTPCLALHALIRRAIQPRRMACVLGSARNEGPYLLDWIAYHRAIGFDHVFMYTNDDTDGSDDLLRLLSGAGAISWIRNEVGPQTRPQVRAYAHALSVLPSILDYRWTLIADPDEYFAYDTQAFASLQHYLTWHDRARTDAIALPWLLHVAKPDDIWQDMPCTARFPYREETVNHHIKTMFRTNRYWSANPHFPDSALGLPANFRAQNGQAHIALAPANNAALAQHPQATHAWISRYIFKSAGEALMQFHVDRDDGMIEDGKASAKDIINPFVALTCKRKLVVDHRTAACGANLAVELARLRDIPGIVACDAAIKRAYAQRMDEARTDFIRRSACIEDEAHRMFRNILIHDGPDGSSVPSTPLTGRVLTRAF